MLQFNYTNLRRNKRDIEQATETNKRRRVVKKLIRVAPRFNRTLNTDTEESTTESDEPVEDVTQKSRPRKRLLIKKKRKPINRIVPTKTLPRRKVIITKKRLISKNNIQNQENNDISINNDTTTTEIPTETPVSAEEIQEEQDTETPTNEYDEELLNDEYVTTESDLSQNLNLPDYEPFFPELSESLDAPVLLLKTTVLSSVDLETKTVVQSKLRTYTFLITRVNGDEQIVTSTTEVKPHTKTIVITEPHTKYTTLTLLDLDRTETVPYIPQTVVPLKDSSRSDTGGESVHYLL